MNDYDENETSVNNNSCFDHRRKILFEPVCMDCQADDIDGNDPYLLQCQISNNNDNHQNLLLFSFWMLGVLNNASYVIMLAAAKNISEGGTALVFLANILPSLLIKGSAPYWFDKISYQMRMQVATFCMISSFGLVASSRQLAWQLFGVAFGSLQGGLGEPSLLALAGKTDGAFAAASERTSDDNTAAATTTTTARQEANAENPRNEEEKGQCLTCFASGTGFAGVFGFFWKWFWNDWLQFSLPTTLWLAMGLAFGYWSTFQFVMKQQVHYQQQTHEQQHTVAEQLQEERYPPYHDQELEDASSHHETDHNHHDITSLEDRNNHALLMDDFDNEYDYNNTIDTSIRQRPKEISDMTGWQRFLLVMTLWPYIVPLFTVYMAEYALQSGTWTAIGFPVSDVASRAKFFQYSNWMYQAGVFVSRSSGTLFLAPTALLWLMPLLQVGNVGFYWMVAASQQDHDGHGVYGIAFLYAAAFYTGLLGGAVYCHGYLRVCKDLPLRHREFALSAVSVAECLGIVCADISGLFIQACLYQINGLEGAILTCPLAST